LRKNKKCNTKVPKYSFLQQKTVEETKILSSKEVEAVFRGQSKITQRGQITVPIEVRKKFGLKPGDVLCFLEVDGSIVIKLGPLVLTE